MRHRSSPPAELPVPAPAQPPAPSNPYKVSGPPPPTESAQAVEPSEEEEETVALELVLVDFGVAWQAAAGTVEEAGLGGRVGLDEGGAIRHYASPRAALYSEFLWMTIDDSREHSAALA